MGAMGWFEAEPGLLTCHKYTCTGPRHKESTACSSEPDMCLHWATLGYLCENQVPFFKLWSECGKPAEFSWRNCFIVGAVNIEYQHALLE